MLTKATLVFLLSGFSATAFATPSCPNILEALSDFSSVQSYLNQATNATAADRALVTKIVGEINAAIAYKGCGAAMPPADGAEVFATTSFAKCPNLGMALDIAESGRHRLDVASQDYNGYRQQADNDATSLIAEVAGELYKDAACQ